MVEKVNSEHYYQCSHSVPRTGSIKKEKKRKGLGNICLHQMLSIAWFGVLNLLKKYFLDYILKSER